jgi:hypothetical protein
LTGLKTYLQKPGLLVWPIFILSLATFAFYVTVFFMSLNSLVSDYSWGDIVYHHQIFYNFLHGRPFQTSVYWHALVNSINPYAYLNMVNIHLYLSPFLFSPIYFLVPNLNGLYFTVMAVSYASLAFFLWKLVCLYTMEDRFQKYVLVMSFALANAFIFSLIVGKASPILLGLPFLLASYYFLQREKYFLYYVCSLLFCLSYDDCGLVFISFLVYVFFFERNHLKPAVVSAVMGLLSVGLIIGILQPMARISMIGNSVASVFDAAGVVMSNLNRDYFFTFLHHAGISLLLFGSLILAYPVIRLWSKRSSQQRQDLYQCLGLIFLAPLSHWASISVNVGVHFMPVMAFTLIAITVAISRSTLTVPATWSWQNGLVLVIIVLYLAGNAYAFFFRYPQRHYSYISNEYADEEKVDAKCLQNINSLVPVDKSLTYWTARGLDGFLGNRSNLWRFPHFFDQTDYLVMQKNAKNTFFQAKAIPGQDIYQALLNGTQHSSGQKISIDGKFVDTICDKLVNVNSSHTIMFNDPEMVILKRKERIRFEQPVETYGFGFFKNFPKFWKMKFQG